MARQERGIRTRRTVLVAAAEVFAERGYEACTIAEILSRAGVTKGALYFHFDSKQALLEGVLEEQKPLAPVPSRASHLQEWVDMGMVLAHCTPHDPLLRAGARLATDPYTQERFSRGPWRNWAVASADVLRQAKEYGEVLPHVDPDRTARFVVSTWLGVQLVSQITQGLQDLDERVSEMFRHVLPGLAAPAMLTGLDFAPDRGARVYAEMQQEPLSA